MKTCKRYSKEETKWLTKNYPYCKTEEELYKRYFKKFGIVRKPHNLGSYCNYIGLKKDHYFTEEEVSWLIENYKVNEPTQITYKRFFEKFGKRHTMTSVESECKKLNLHKPKHSLTMLQWEYLQNHIELPKNCYLVKIDGEIEAVEKDIYNKINARGMRNKGELTKTLVEIYRAEKLLRKNGIKRLFHYVPSKEHIDYMNSFPKTYHNLFDKKQALKLFKQKKHYTYEQLAIMYNCSRKTIQKYVRKVKMGLI